MAADLERGHRVRRDRLRAASGLAALAAIPVAALLVFFAWPVVGMVSRGFSHGVPGLGEVFGRPAVLRALWFTIWSSTAATAFTVVLGLPVSFVLYRLRFPGRALLRAFVVMPFVLPTVVVGVAFRTLLIPTGPLGFLGLDGTPAAIIAAMIFFNLSVLVRTVGGMWEGLDRRREEAAAALGATPAQVFRTVTLPALAPAIVSAASVVFLFCATSFGLVLTLGGLHYTTVETQIYLLTTQFLDLRGAAVLSILQLAVVSSLLYAAHRARTSRERSLERRETRARRPRGTDAGALAATALVLAFVAAPLVALAVSSLRVDGGWGLGHYRALTGVGSNKALLVPVTTAVSNSWRIAVDATLLAMVLGLLVSLLLTRDPRGRPEQRALAVLDGAFMLPLGVSAVTVGFGFLITLNRPPVDLRGSALLVPIAQAMVALPLVVRTVAPVLASVDPRQRQAAASLGAAPWRAFATVDLPVVWRPLLAATGFAFAVSIGEFGATSFLVRPDRPTLPVVIYTLLSRPGAEDFGMAMAASVVLAVLTASVMGLVERLRVGNVGAF
ncbi:MAG: ABC transporter permease [Nocardioidaceae bacterium]